jgi:hypothetical protein
VSCRNRLKLRRSLRLIAFSLFPRALGNFLQRSGFLNVSGEKDDDGAGSYDCGRQPDDALKRLALVILFAK